MERAVAAFDAPPPDPDMAPWCFEPHHGILFYDDEEKLVAAVSVCFECQRALGWAPTRRGDAVLSASALQVFRDLFCGELGLDPCAQ